MKSPLSTKERMEIGIFRFLILFPKIWKTGERYKAERIRERIDLWPTPISTLEKREEKLFQKYLVFLPTR